MEKRIIPYDQWPWWVRFFIIPSGSRVWGNSGQGWMPFFYWLGGILIIFGTDYKSGSADVMFNSILLIFNLGMFMTFQSYAVNWIYKHSDPGEMKEEPWVKRIVLGVIQALIAGGLPLLYIYLDTRGWL